MGQFESGNWIVILLIYFTIFFVVTYCVVAGMTENSANSGVSYSDPGYGSVPTNDHAIGMVNQSSVSTSSPGMSDVLTTLSVITNVGSGSYQLGIDSAWTWLFSFLFFYIPFFMLLWAIYMALPIIH